MCCHFWRKRWGDCVKEICQWHIFSTKREKMEYIFGLADRTASKLMYLFVFSEAKKLHLSHGFSFPHKTSMKFCGDPIIKHFKTVPLSRRVLKTIHWIVFLTDCSNSTAKKEAVKNTAFGGSGGIRTHVPDYSDNRISSAAHCDRFDTLPTRTIIQH